MSEKQWKFMPEVGVPKEKPAFIWMPYNVPTETQTNLEKPENREPKYSNTDDLLVLRLLLEKPIPHISTPICKPKIYRGNKNLLEPLNVGEDFSFSIFFESEIPSVPSKSSLLSDTVGSLQSDNFFYRRDK